MIALIFVAAAAAFVCIAIRVLQRSGRGHPLHALSLLSAAGGIVVWPTSNALAFDRLTHAPGLAHLVTDSLLPLTFLLQFRFASRIRRGWSPRRRLLLGVGLGLIGLHALLWALDERTVPGDHIHLWYDHYYGRPPQLLITYAVLTASVLYSALCCLDGYAPSLARQRPLRERLLALGISLLALGAVVYSPLIVGQSIASAEGLGSSSVTAFTFPIMGVTTAIGLITVLGLLFGRRLWMALTGRVWTVIEAHGPSAQTLELMRRESEQQARRHVHMVNLAIAIDDRLLHVRQDYAAGEAVEDVTRVCTERGICWEHRKIGREAVRIITLAFDNVYETPFYDEDETEDQTGMAEYFLLHADESYCFDDVYKVAFLGVGGATLLPELEAPDEFEFEPWHHELGAIVAEALEAYKSKRRKREWCLAD